MSRLTQLFFLISLFVVTISCQKEDDKPVGKAVEIYLIDEFETEGQLKIIASSVKLASQPLIKYTDIISYKPSTSTFLFSTIMADSLSHFDTNGLLRKAFAVTVDNEVIYTGYFWASFFSSMCDWYAIDLVDFNDSNPATFYVTLGYPETLYAGKIPDYRNDERILNVFRQDGKLFE